MKRVWESIKRRATKDNTQAKTEIDFYKKVQLNSLKDFFEMARVLFKSASKADIVNLFYAFKMRVEEVSDELGKEHPTDLRNAFGLLGTTFLKDLTGSGQHMLMPNLEDVNEVFLTRLYPLLSKKEIGLMNDAHVVVFGASTASAVALALTQMGIGRITIIDPDVISMSNLNRITGASQTDIGKNKALFVAKHLLKVNPSLKITAVPHILEEQDAKQAIKSATVVVEMIDSLPAKYNIRKLMRAVSSDEQKVYVGMATNVDEPLITVEGNNDPLFLNNDVSTAEIEELMKVTNPLEFMAGVIQIIGVKNIPLRQMVNFILVAERKLKYMAQHGSSAMGAAWGLSYTLQKMIIGVKLKESSITLSVEDVFDSVSLDNSDIAYLEELKEKYPELFSDHESLMDAVKYHCNRLFGITY